MTTEFGESVNRVSLACTVTCAAVEWSSESTWLDNFLALIRLKNRSIGTHTVNGVRISSYAKSVLQNQLKLDQAYHSITAAPHVKPAPNTTSSIRSPF